VSITEGVAFGLIAYLLLKTVAGRTRDGAAAALRFSALFLARYARLS
jgi:xanthine/uracil/vitamin C permease (AzgA family)